MATTGICPCKRDSLLLVVVLVQLKTFASLVFRAEEDSSLLLVVFFDVIRTAQRF
ncbi:hypothetical protein [Natranaeroarchaeum aerophilus]|uniref:Uncharacterized protein n=1 Tax=Natranaeroarchaeum aerophilus TaxID=2917711 RepID=A0AAE3K6M1_9EURY|nr:hypothetical protein [Natranaeroarchaeum aerophilus]MCL9814555.1 hypothetical protein [Natranaeroarchaeum aerophilus]